MNVSIGNALLRGNDESYSVDFHADNIGALEHFPHSETLDREFFTVDFLSPDGGTVRIYLGRQELEELGQATETALLKASTLDPRNKP